MNAARRAAPARERLLIAALAVVVAALALSLSLKLLGAARRDAAATRASLERAETLLNAEPLLRARLADAGVTPGTGRPGAAWLASAEAHARACGLSAEAGNPVVERRGGVEFHRVRLHLRAPSLEPLLAFDTRLRADSGPGVADRFVIESRDADGVLSATYDITLCLLAE